MIDLDEIIQYFPEVQQKNPLHFEYMLMINTDFHGKTKHVVFKNRKLLQM